MKKGEETPNMAVQAWVDVRDLAAAICFAEANNLDLNRGYSEIIRLALQRFAIGTFRHDNVADALRELKLRGFSTRQFLKNKNAAKFLNQASERQSAVEDAFREAQDERD